MRYIALLRGINISGKNKILMKDLKSCFVDFGYRNVCTYLNSGNVIFDYDGVDKNIIIKDIVSMIKERFEIFIPVYVMTSFELENILNNCPDWWGNDDKSIYDNLIFVIPSVTAQDVYDTIGEPNEVERVEKQRNVIYWSFDLNNYRKSNWWVKTASCDIRNSITIRTANTMKKVLSLC